MASNTTEVLEYPLTEHVTVGRMADGAINAGDVVASGTNEEDVATATGGDYPLGVAVPKTTYDASSDDGSYSDGDRVKVALSGVVYLEADGSISEGATVVVSSSTDGAVTEAPTVDAGTTNTYDPSERIGRALEGGSDGDRIAVFIG